MAQTDSVYWDFGTTSSPTVYASISSNTNVPANNCEADTGNVCCTPFTSGGTYAPPYLANNFSSSGQYAGASGEPTLRNNAKSGSFNASTSTYLSFTVTPNTGYIVTIKSISFGVRSIFFGPTSYAIRTSADGYSSNVGTGSLSSANYGAKKTHGSLTITGTASTPLEVRVYAYGGLSTTSSGNFLMDDMVIEYTVAAAGCTGTPTSGTAVATVYSMCDSGASTLNLTGASSGSGITRQWYSSISGTPASFLSISGATITPYTTPTLTDTTYFYCVTSCANSLLSDTSNTVVVNINPSIANTVVISASDTTICAGDTVIFTASRPNNSSLVSLPTATLTCTQSTTATSSCVGSGGSFANGWTSSGAYWQYKISTIGYEDIVFSTPTSSSGTGPHSGSVHFSTDGVNYSQITNYSWTGTGCTSTGNIPLPASGNNQANVYVRLYMTGASSSSGTNRVNPNAFKGKAMLQDISPIYQWKKNGVNVGTDTSIYIDYNLVTNDEISIIQTSPHCVSPDTAISDTITMIVNPLLTPSLTISSSDTTICAGTLVTFTAAPTNGGSSPTYQWKLNGSNVGSNSDTFSSSSLSNTDMIECELTSNASCLTQTMDTSNAITMTVNPMLTPSVTISVTPDDTICAGTPVTFTATATNGGSSPAYQWKLNGSNVGSNSDTFSSSSLSNTDMIECELTSNASCLTQTMDTSNAITMTVNPMLTPSVTISVTPDDTICAGTPVTFTATATNGGSSSAYQWKLNGFNVGTNSDTFSISSLSNNDVVKCVLTSNANCLTQAMDTSNAITMTVNPMLTPSVTISVSPDDTICAGTSVTFTATPANGGSAPAYQWKLNGSNAGSNNATFSSSSLSNNDVIECVLTSNAGCLTQTTDTSDAVTMTVNPVLTPSVTISVSPNDTICAGTSVTFTASPMNGGSTPAYQWKLNGSNAGSNNATFNSNSFSNNDVVGCVLTSNAGCLTQVSDTSNAITMTVNPLLTPSVTISVSPGDTICAGTSVTFTATPANGGSAPTYQWKLNSSNAGSNSATFSSGSLSNNDVVECVVTSNASCLTQGSDTSNAITMTVNPLLTPQVTITVSPDDTICAGTLAIFTAVSTNGGASPMYQWKKNGNSITGATGSVWSASNLAHADIISCVLTSSEVCSAPDKDTSNGILMTVPAVSFPKVSVVVTPGTKVGQGTSVLFTAIVSDGGVTPAYQWRKNGVDMPGETNSTYTTNTLNDSDIINVFVRSSDSCANPDTVLSQNILMDITVSVGNVYTNNSEIKLYPNPNNGMFVLDGVISLEHDNEEALIEVINSVGVVVYRERTVVQNKKLNKQIDLDDSMSQGMYMVRISIEGGKRHMIKFILN